jgi:hypothetical protein
VCVCVCVCVDNEYSFTHIQTANERAHTSYYLLFAYTPCTHSSPPHTHTHTYTLGIYIHAGPTEKKKIVFAPYGSPRRCRAAARCCCPGTSRVFEWRGARRRRRRRGSECCIGVERGAYPRDLSHFHNHYTPFEARPFLFVRFFCISVISHRRAKN